MSDSEHPLRRALVHVFATGGLVLGYLAVVHAAVSGANDARSRAEDLAIQAFAAPAFSSFVSRAQGQAALDFHHWYGSIFVMNTVIGLFVLLIGAIGIIAAWRRVKRKDDRGETRNVGWYSFGLDAVLVVAFAITMLETHAFSRAAYVRECELLGQNPVYPPVVLKLNANAEPTPMSRAAPQDP